MKHNRTGRPELLVSAYQVKSGTNENTYKRHDLLHGTLNVKSFNTLDSNHVTLRGQRREHDVGAIGLHDLPNLVHPSK